MLILRGYFVIFLIDGLYVGFCHGKPVADLYEDDWLYNNDPSLNIGPCMRMVMPSFERLHDFPFICMNLDMLLECINFELNEMESAKSLFDITSFRIAYTGICFDLITKKSLESQMSVCYSEKMDELMECVTASETPTHGSPEDDCSILLATAVCESDVLRKCNETVADAMLNYYLSISPGTCKASTDLTSRYDICDYESFLPCTREIWDTPPTSSSTASHLDIMAFSDFCPKFPKMSDSLMCLKDVPQVRLSCNTSRLNRLEFQSNSTEAKIDELCWCLWRRMECEIESFVTCSDKVKQKLKDSFRKSLPHMCDTKKFVAKIPKTLAMKLEARTSDSRRAPPGGTYVLVQSNQTLPTSCSFLYASTPAFISLLCIYYIV